MKQNLVRSTNLRYKQRKKKRSAINPQQIFKTLVRNATFAMSQNKRSKRKATFAEVAVCPLLLNTHLQIPSLQFILFIDLYKGHKRKITDSRKEPWSH